MRVLLSLQNGFAFLVPAAMHRDAKLGLALGILVIGFAAAFCFPRHAGLPAHVRVGDGTTEANALDERLALRSVKVYTNARHPSDLVEPAPVLPIPTPGPTVDPDIVVTVDAQYLTGSVAAGPSSGRLPTRREPDRPTMDPDQGEPVDDAEPVGITHTVRPGETLSSIALMHLGGSSRYSEVFELNRDLLASPDALQIGMELKIPPKIRPRLPASGRTESGPVQIADGQPDRRVSDRVETRPSSPDAPFHRGEARPTAGFSVREPEPTLAEPYLPTTAIPAAASDLKLPESAPARRGASSVGASLRSRRG